MSFDAAFARAIADVTKEYIDKRDKILMAELEATKRRVDDLERKSLVYQGLYNRAASYRRNDLITFRGRLFVAARNTTADEPGISPQWTPLLGDMSK